MCRGSMQDTTADIPIDCIVEPRTVLRLIDKNSVEYLEMRDSIAAEGFWNSISVRPAREPQKYEIIDGNGAASYAYPYVESGTQ